MPNNMVSCNIDGHNAPRAHTKLVYQTTVSFYTTIQEVGRTEHSTYENFKYHI